ncbi:MAG: hypothetical protein DRJ59_03710 [Thermoprotei archaeon]|nr:MAG: hypothetical protein DRJ59_03710 [Thermoprotei archaeon]
MKRFLREGDAFRAGVEIKGATEIHVPGKSGVMLDTDMPVGETWSIDYPVMLNAQFLLAKVGDKWIRVGTRYKPLHFSNVFVKQLVDGFKIIWELRPWSGYSKPRVPKLLVDEFGTMDEAVEDYKSWMERAFKIRKKEENPNIPKWAFNTRLVLIVDMWASDGVILADYSDVIKLVEELEELGAPRDTILYLPGWSWRWDGRYPEYYPAKELGGPERFGEMVEVAREAGYKIMPSMNCLGLDYSLPAYRKLWRYQIVDRHGRKRGWPGTFPGAATLPFAYMRPCARAWRKYLLGNISKVVLEFALEAVYLDQTLVVIDDPKCNMELGLKRLIEELRAQIPGVLISGEGCHERIVGSVSFCQMHGSPWSMTSVGIPYEKDSLVFVKLFGDYAFFYGHISIPPSFPGRQVGLLAKSPYYNKFWNRWGYEYAQKYYDFRGAIKTIRINYRDFGLDEESRKVIQSLKLSGQ